jgi:hypothetical protein
MNGKAIKNKFFVEKFMKRSEAALYSAIDATNYKKLTSM